MCPALADLSRYLDGGCPTWDTCYHGSLEPTMHPKYSGASACAWELAESEWMHRGVWVRLAAVAGNFWSNATARFLELHQSDASSSSTDRTTVRLHTHTHTHNTVIQHH